MDKIIIGDCVRSFDFPMLKTREERMECYVEGVVVGITDCKTDKIFRDCNRYKIRCCKRIWDSKKSSKHEDFYFPPVNGTPSMFGGVTNTVERV